MYDYKGIVTKVVDGDTLDIQLDLGFKIYHSIRTRLLNVDAHEIKSNDPEEKRKAEYEKNYVKNLALDKIVTVNTRKQDKYGRWLSVITLDSGETVNDLIGKIIATS